jgi:rare lipoprotein A
MTGTTVAALGLNPAAHSTRADAGATAPGLAPASAERAQQRADRSEPRLSPTAEATPSATPSAAPSSASPSAPLPLTAKTTKTATSKPAAPKPAAPKPTPPADSGAVVSSGSCEASFYTDEGSRTANGETFHTAAFTAAHKTLKFNTKVRVTNVKNGKSVVVRINDRGPFVAGRCIDLTPAAFNTISSTSAGVAPVKYEVLQG